MILKDFFQMLGISTDCKDNSHPNYENSFFAKNVWTNKRTQKAINCLFTGFENIYNNFQSIQGGKFEKMMDSRTYVFIFIGDESANAVFHSCYKKIETITVREALERNLIDPNYEDKIEKLTELDNPYYIYEPILTPGKLEDRLVMNFKTNMAYCVKPSTLSSSEIIQILPEKKATMFTSYDDVHLTYQQLCDVVKDETWQDALSRFGGIYLIRDTKEAKMYVGAAYGKNGIFGRWQDYAKNPTGGTDNIGNTALVKLLAENGGKDYAKKYFMYSILEVLPLTRTQAILDAEVKWKQRLGTRNPKFGLNDN